ncbi:hypothetical protein CPB85DRAFT_1433824 [Mucidula mucida]|nr:hypothetical protein CPB85DRAFT_1433824 [Mucidula mucida]
MDAVVLPSLRILNIHECEFVLHDGEFMVYYEDLNVLLPLAESRSTTRMSVGLWDRPCKSLRTLRLPKYYNPFQDLDDEELDRWINVANEIKIICS